MDFARMLEAHLREGAAPVSKQIKRRGAKNGGEAPVVGWPHWVWLSGPANRRESWPRRTY